MKKFYIGLLLSGFVFQQSYADGEGSLSKNEKIEALGQSKPTDDTTFKYGLRAVTSLPKKLRTGMSDFYTAVTAPIDQEDRLRAQQNGVDYPAFEHGLEAVTSLPKRWANTISDSYAARKARLKDEALDRLVAQQDDIALRDYIDAKKKEAAALRVLQAKKDMLRAKSENNRQELERAYFKRAQELQAAGPLTEADAAQLEGLRRIAFGDRPVPVMPTSAKFDWGRFNPKRIMDDYRQRSANQAMRADEIVSAYEARQLKEEMDRQGQEELRQLEMSNDRDRAALEAQRAEQAANTRDLTGVMTQKEWADLQAKRDAARDRGVGLIMRNGKASLPE